MCKFIALSVFALACVTANSAEHHSAPAPHHNSPPPPRVQPQQHPQQHQQQQRHEEHKEARTEHREEHKAARHEEHKEARVGQHREHHHHQVAERIDYRHRDAWDHNCHGGNWVVHNGCHRWINSHVVWGGNFNCYVGIFGFQGDFCIFPNVIFDFGIELPPMVVIDDVEGHYELQQVDFVVTEEIKEKVWIAPSVTVKVGFWKEVIHPAVMEKRECRVWVAN